MTDPGGPRSDLDYDPRLNQRPGWVEELPVLAAGAPSDYDQPTPPGQQGVDKRARRAL